MKIDTGAWNPSLTQGLLKSTTTRISSDYQARLDAIAQQGLSGKSTRKAVFRRVVGAIKRQMKDIIVASGYDGEGKDIRFNVAYVTPLEGNAGWMIAGSTVSFRKPNALVPAGVMWMRISDHAWQRAAACLKTTTPSVIGTIMFEHGVVLDANPGVPHTATPVGLVFWGHDTERPVAKTFISTGRLEPRNLKLWQKAMEEQR